MPAWKTKKRTGPFNIFTTDVQCTRLVDPVLHQAPQRTCFGSCINCRYIMRMRMCPGAHPAPAPLIDSSCLVAAANERKQITTQPCYDKSRHRTRKQSPRSSAALNAVPFLVLSILTAPSSQHQFCHDRPIVACSVFCSCVNARSCATSAGIAPGAMTAPACSAAAQWHAEHCSWLRVGTTSTRFN